VIGSKALGHSSRFAVDGPVGLMVTEHGVFALSLRRPSATRFVNPGGGEPAAEWGAMLVRERPSWIDSSVLRRNSACTALAQWRWAALACSRRCAGLPTNVGHLRVGSLH
jgi:hypothetical protein